MPHGYDYTGLYSENTFTTIILQTFTLYIIQPRGVLSKTFRTNFKFVLLYGRQHKIHYPRANSILFCLRALHTHTHTIEAAAAPSPIQASLYAIMSFVGVRACHFSCIVCIVCAPIQHLFCLPSRMSFLANIGVLLCQRELCLPADGAS